MAKTTIPTFDTLLNPLIQALKSLGGSGTVEELYTKVVEMTGISKQQLEMLHNPQKGGVTEVEYRLGWSRTYLKKFGVLENSNRGVWALTSLGRKLDRVDEKEVLRVVRGQIKNARKIENAYEPEGELETENDPTIQWRSELLDMLLQIEPSAFERLVQRILRESGFIQVEVTGRSGDGGIDGKGIMRLGGLLSFHVIFQCKRYRGAVNVSQVRDFRGAMVGRADKGLLITTGTFTQDAIKEATRDGAPPIDLIDSEQLLDKMKELSLGLETKKVESELVVVNRDWFANI